MQDPSVFGIPVDFILFGLTLACVAVFHKCTMRVALTGLLTIIIYKITFTGFKTGAGIMGFISHVGHEWVILVNLLCLLLGFALLSQHFEKSQLPLALPKFLPDDWKGGFVLLVMIWALSSFLDNIAAALIGGAMAHQLFRGKVHIGYVAAIVAASNAGGSWSVLGDTTTTMMWIAGVAPSQVFEAITAATVALAIFGIPAAIKQHRHSPILKGAHEHPHIDWMRIGIVILILVAAVSVNITINTKYPDYSGNFPFIGVAVWAAIAISIGVRRPDWEVLPRTLRSSMFLLSLVLIASMMPVERLPEPSARTTLGLGFVSAVFDNIPLTALALEQGGYDWGPVAYAVGFGGSMIWFGSSAGVAISSVFPEAKSAVAWIKGGWFVVLAYLVGFAAMFAVTGWHPQPKERPGQGRPERLGEHVTSLVRNKPTWQQS
jgi:Na+/H+ antiporter NhaD/arsenite permease-like protein